ncbi:carboxymuconolactone decarboxylase family protein [Aquitalea sp. LB_tupeE]|uniref:carboxymuconolactone decarboxylase family protein n=1 Tax=Aquitalea sp. LB_tupeE TaxID=2748078 RepID=UPI0015BA0F75|nr:carboxymuconolactone decarboxylase family protein [Aquitalea sp. LB_tupeE]NWK79742.1 carboxymuconolactone decarboxylase family protein [Aquitalea sp. LB_tupeE]
MSKETFEQGLSIRKAVLGEDYVNQALSNADELSMPLQQLVTEYCWGTVWAREGLPRKTRSLINLGMIAALNRPHELKLHVRGALNNGCSKEEVVEAILQIAIYCGVPAAVDAMRIAREVFAETGSSQTSSTQA